MLPASSRARATRYATLLSIVPPKSGCGCETTAANDGATSGLATRPTRRPVGPSIETRVTLLGMEARIAARSPSDRAAVLAALGRAGPGLAVARDRLVAAEGPRPLRHDVTAPLELGDDLARHAVLQMQLAAAARGHV